MEPVAFLEILDRHGRVASRHRVDDLPLRIGRGYTNEVILDDPYVSPIHARVEDRGGLPVLMDAGSDNGIVLPGRGRVATLPLETGVRFRLGRTDLRFCTAEQRVEPALREEGGRFNPLALTRTSGRRWLVAAVAFAAIALQQGLSTYQRQTWVEPAGAAFTVAVFVAVWAGGWAVANRIVAQLFRFWTHFLWAAVLLVAFLLADVLFQYADFAIGLDAAARSLDFVTSVALGTLLLAGHLRVIGQIGRRRRLVTAVAIAVAVTFLVTAVNQADEDEFTTSLPSAGPLKPLSDKLLVRQTVDHFVEGTADLKAELDRLAE